MARRRENSRSFSVETVKSPHVLDLRQNIASKLRSDLTQKIVGIARNDRGERKKQKLRKKIVLPTEEAPLSKDSLFKELEIIESKDAILATKFNIPQNLISKAPKFKPQLIAKKNAAVSREDSMLENFARRVANKGIMNLVNNGFTAHSRRPAPAIRNFVFAAGAIALLLFGIFFAQKGFALKSKGIESGIMAYESFLDAEKSLSLLDFGSAEKDFSRAYDNLASAEESLKEVGEITISIVRNIPFDTKIESSLALLKASKHIAKSGEILSSAFNLFASDGAISPMMYFDMIIGQKDDGESRYLTDVFRALREKLELSKEELAQANYYIKNADPEDFPEEFRKNISSLNQKIPVLLNIIEVAKDYANISEILLGEQRPMKYLILLQNSSELRPTGGFIGTYAILEVQNGRLLNMLVDGIYNIDGQLTVNIVPPEQFQHIATGWSTHDANWFLDFPTSAEKIGWFYERAGGGEVDGVITLNIELIEKLLAITGEIPVREYNLALNADNFRDEIQHEVEAAYDKELNSPKKIISDFTPIFLEKLYGVISAKNKEIFSVIVDSLEQKHVMFYFKNPSVQKFFESQGWSGSIAQTNADDTRTNADKLQPSDYLAVAHSNIGGYKTDKFMKDEIKYSVEIQDDGSLIGNAEIARTHNGGDSKYWWYNRSNIDYVKVYVPEGSRIIDSSGGARRKVKSPVDYSALNFDIDPYISRIESSMEHNGVVDIFEETGKTVFGTWLITNPKSTSRFSISYELPFKVSFNNDAAKYNLYMQKQPGTKTQISVNVDYPRDWEVMWENSEDNFKKSFILDTDKVLGYIFKR